MTSITAYLQTSRNENLDRNALVDYFDNIYFSGTTYSLWKEARSLTAAYSKGTVLDAGSGRGGWREVIEENGAVREALDWQQLEGEKLDWVGDLTDMPQVPDDRFDSVVCHQVLEHIAEPAKALQEMHRVLKPEGHLVLSVPHLSRLHELPHDYFRYTPNGIAALAEQTGFEVEQISTFGGVFTFLHHQFSTILVGLASVTSVTAKLAICINAPLSLLSTGLDHLLDRKRHMPNGIIAVLKKKP